MSTDERHVVAGILAHVDAGKTTLSEALLYESGKIRKRGRVDHADAYLDTTPLERQRGITMMAHQTQLTYRGLTITLLDTPGHVDFSAETERVLAVLDIAILVVSAVDGVQSHTQTLWELLRRHHIPTYIVVNKIDAQNADIERVIQELQVQCSPGCIRINPSSDMDEQGNLIAGPIDDVAVLSDATVEEALAEGMLSCERVQQIIHKEMLFPCIAVSSLQQQHIDQVLTILSAWCTTPKYSEQFGAKVFRVSHDPKHARLTWLKVTGGVLQSKSILHSQLNQANPSVDTIARANAAAKAHSEKIDQIRLYDADSFTIAQEVPAGHICAVTGLQDTHAGDGFGYETSQWEPQLQPVLNYAVVPAGMGVEQSNQRHQSEHYGQPSPRTALDQHVLSHQQNIPDQRGLLDHNELIAQQGLSTQYGLSDQSNRHKVQYQEASFDNSDRGRNHTDRATDDRATDDIEQARSIQQTLPVFDDITLHRVLEGLRELEDEDPLLHVRWMSDIQQIHIQCMGAIQQEVIVSRMQERFGLSITCIPAGIIYKETIQGAIEGVGHFEPLRHYAEVHVKIEQMPQGSGVSYGLDIAPNTLAEQWKRLIVTHIAEREHKGVLIGAPLTDVCITAIAGKGHEKHTEGGDFRQATYRAIRQGLMRAREQGRCILLEPWYRFVLEVPQTSVGRALSDIQWMHGQLDSQEVTTRGYMRIEGTCPVATMNEYAVTVASYTHGEGRLSTLLDGYRPCHNAEQIIASAAYDPVADLEHTPDSVFCSHGAGYPVSWDHVPEHMHIDYVM